MTSLTNVSHLPILAYWFPATGTPREWNRLWFGGEPETDREIQRRFEPLVLAAAEGRLAGWEAEPDSCLALVILLDQFTLNIYRDQARSFELNALALPIALRALERGFDKRVEPRQRAFIYLPLEHAEDLAIQDRAVTLFRKLADQAPPGEEALFESFHRYAVLHQEVIARFGRFPDRNPILGRSSTPEEAEYLAQGGPPF